MKYPPEAGDEVCFRGIFYPANRRALGGDVMLIFWENVCIIAWWHPGRNITIDR